MTKNKNEFIETATRLVHLYLKEKKFLLDESFVKPVVGKFLFFRSSDFKMRIMFSLYNGDISVNVGSLRAENISQVEKSGEKIWFSPDEFVCAPNPFDNMTNEEILVELSKHEDEFSFEGSISSQLEYVRDNYVEICKGLIKEEK